MLLVTMKNVESETVFLYLILQSESEEHQNKGIYGQACDRVSELICNEK